MVLLWSHHFAADKRSEFEERGHALLPLLWFTAGYCLVLVLRSKKFPWPRGLWTVAPLRRTRHRRDRRRRAPVKSEVNEFLHRHRNNVIYLTQLKKGEPSVPCLELIRPDNPEAFEFGDYNATIRYAVEQIADIYYRIFKEPLPDPASRLLIAIEVLEERHSDECNALFKRRLLRFRNEAPSLIKRFASSAYIEYIEDSLLDKQNQIFYVYVKNKSYQSLGLLEDFAVYKAHSDKPQWTNLHQVCRVHITSSSLLFFRSKIESFISSYYCKNAPDARRYHLQRLKEELGDPVELR
ncbi:unnamed protein product [Peronospora destructor]|uniref:PRELI/MSF1 domain-containing protein n=1 Tax=Peronospora destructor TaxID=86335 RepID=A0AAV0U5P3_9STRA|nr:unnamed protein product [Peronospora destructor]